MTVPYRVVKAVRDHSRARGTARSVLYTMATYADPDGTSIYPNLTTICRGAGVARKTGVDAMQRLIETGEIERVAKRSSGTFEYHIGWPMVLADLHREGAFAECESGSETEPRGSSDTEPGGSREKSQRSHSGSDAEPAAVQSREMAVQPLHPGSSAAEHDPSSTDSVDQSIDQNSVPSLEKQQGDETEGLLREYQEVLATTTAPDRRALLERKIRELKGKQAEEMAA